MNPLKNILSALCLLLAAGMLHSCAMKDSPDDINDPITTEQTLTGQGITVVRLARPEQAQEVMAAHPAVEYNRTRQLFDFDETVLQLCRVSSTQWNAYSPSLLQTMDERADIQHHPALIDLGNGYFAVDWRWADLLPVSSFSFRGTDAMIKDLVAHHCFATGSRWEDLHSLTQEWTTEDAEPLEVTELWRVTYRHIDLIRHTSPQDAKGTDISRAIHYGGMKPENIVFYGISPALYDSLQAFYLNPALFREEMRTFFSTGTTNADSTGVSVLRF